MTVADLIRILQAVEDWTQPVWIQADGDYWPVTKAKESPGTANEPRGLVISSLVD